jgi:hypothetical protein
MTQALNFVIFLNITFISFDKYYYYSQYHLLEIRILYNKLVIVLTVNTALHTSIQQADIERERERHSLKP